MSRRPVAPHPFLDAPGPIAFAHRGGAGDLPENTLAAFEAAVRLGYRYVETDVHATADGVLVAFHDERLDRVTDARGAIAELTWDEVARARVGGSEPIARLEDLLAAWPAIRVNIDAKADGSVRPLARTLRATGALERVCVGSFSSARLRALHDELGDALCTSLGPSGVRALRLASWGLRPMEAGVLAERGRCVQVPVRYGPLPIIDRRFVVAAGRLGLPVHAWTIDEPGEMERLLEMGVAGLMTDRPGVLREVLVRRGAWAGGAADDGPGAPGAPVALPSGTMRE